MEKKLPLIVLGSGSNTIFADATINALVVQIRAANVIASGNEVRTEGGKNLAMLINELAKSGLDLSALTGIPGTVGGAIFGNAGQGPTGTWIDSYVKEVTVYDGVWHTFERQACQFRYRESIFKHAKPAPIIWETALELPSAPAAEIQANVEALLKKRIETQPHLRTAGSCFKAIGDTPAWKLIDGAGLRGYKVGDVQIAEKHANFLLNLGKATYEDAKTLVNIVKRDVTSPLEVEMRFVESDGSLAF